MALPVLAAGALWTALRYILWTVLLALVEPILSRILLALGVGFISYTGISSLLNSVTNLIYRNLQGLPADILSVLALAGVGKAISIICAAFLMKMTLSGMSSAGSVVKMRLAKK